MIYVASYWIMALESALKLNKKKAAWITSTILLIILILRNDQLGTDIEGYHKIFDFISSRSLIDVIKSLTFFRVEDFYGQYKGEVIGYKFEPAYVLLNWVFGNLANFHIFLVFCAVINIYSISYFFYKFSDDFAYSYIMFCALGSYVYCFSILRQMLALSIAIWALPEMEKGKNLRACIIIFLAFFFHRTAIILLPLLILKKIVLTRNKWIGAIGACVLFASTLPLVSMYILRPVYRFFYKDWAELAFSPHFSMLDFILVSVALYTYFFYKFKNFKKVKNNILGWGFLLLLALRMLTAYDPTLSRSAQYFFVLCYAFIPNIIQNQDRSSRKLVKTGLALFLFFYFMRGIFLSDIFPYRVFWRNI